MIKILFFSVVILLLNSCSYLPNWIGVSENSPKLKGERVSILNYETNLNSAPDQTNKPLDLPLISLNKNSFRSYGFHSSTYLNSSLGSIQHMTKRSIGKRAKKGNYLSSRPIVADNKVITMDAKGLIQAFNVSDIKTLVWQNNLSEKGNYFVAGGMAFGEGKIFVNTGGNKVIAIDVKNGRQIWQRDIQSITRSAPEVSGKFLLVNTLDNKLYALNAENGGLIWTHSGFSETISIFGVAPPIAYEKIVFASYSSGELYALNIKTGEEIWLDSFDNQTKNTKFTLNDIDATPVVSGDMVYSISNDGLFIANDLATGNRKWQIELSSVNTPWIVGNYIFLIDNQKRFVAVDKKTSEIRWINQLAKFKNEKTKRGSIRYTSPVMADNKLYVANSIGKLLVFDPSNGDMLKKHEIPKDIYLSPVIAYDKIFLFTNDAELVSMGAKN